MIHRKLEQFQLKSHRLQLEKEKRKVKFYKFSINFQCLKLTTKLSNKAK
jgi:UDP-N-acetylmuramoylalanine-D-glutamate ligase